MRTEERIRAVRRVIDQVEALISRDRPSDLGLAPFGEEKVQATPPPPKGNVRL
jgi:hypothetical protein